MSSDFNLGFDMVFFLNCTVLFHYMDVSIKGPSGLMLLVLCYLTIKNISYLILAQGMSTYVTNSTQR